MLDANCTFAREGTTDLCYRTTIGGDAVSSKCSAANIFIPLVQGEKIYPIYWNRVSAYQWNFESATGVFLILILYTISLWKRRGDQGASPRTRDSKMISIFSLLYFLHFSILCSARDVDEKVVSVELAGQLGNQLFQLAAGYAHALDTNASFIIPDLLHKSLYNIPHNTARLYNFISQFHQEDPRIGLNRWNQPSFRFTPIPDIKNPLLIGYFQSEKYFSHRRDEVRDLFSPPKHIKDAVLSNHTILTSGNYTVGVQVRDYRAEQPSGRFHPTLTSSYYDQAMASFPDNAIFIVSTNNQNYAKEITKKYAHRSIYLDTSGGEDYIDHFYALYFCRAFIIANSSFGWWAAWLSQSVGKIIVAPKTWFATPYNNDDMTKDLYPLNFTLM